MFACTDRVRVNIRGDRETEGPESRGRLCVQGGNSPRATRAHSFVDDVRSKDGGAQDPSGPTPRDAPFTGCGPAGDRSKGDADDEIQDPKEEHSPDDRDFHSRTWISGYSGDSICNAESPRPLR